MKRSLIFLLVTAALTALAQVTPSWWSGRGALTPGAGADDFAAINQGQLKNLARAAVLEFDEKLPGGAGPQLSELIASWEVPGEETDDYAVVTHGQLKAMADLFYARLEVVRSQIAPDWSSVETPWASSMTGLGTPQHTAVVNIGQVKQVFAGLEGDRSLRTMTGLTGAAPGQEDLRFGLGWLVDSDQDGMNDVAELVAGTNPMSAETNIESDLPQSLVVFTPFR